MSARGGAGRGRRVSGGTVTPPGMCVSGHLAKGRVACGPTLSVITLVTGADMVGRVA